MEYSVIPSTEVTFWTPGGKVCEKAAAAKRSAAMAVKDRTVRRIGTFTLDCSDYSRR
jgi:hypothetical protein